MTKHTFSPVFLTGLLTLTLSGCSVLDIDKENLATSPQILENQALHNEKNTNNGLVVESLVSDASMFGNIDIDSLIGLPLNPDLIESLDHQVEPITPTVAMTANRLVERRMNDYLQNRRRLIKIWVERGQTYFPMIEKIFEEEGVPDELKYIAISESDLRASVRSSAGAVGMWQFMAATGRGAGLTINPWVDERMDPEKATRAAAKHLKALYTSYSGNWHLVLAGYNCSYRCISRAVRRAGGSIDNPPSFWEIYPFLPKETRNFVPKFITNALIVSNPEMYGISTENFGQEFSYDIVEVNGMLSLEDAASLAGIDLASIKKLNPSLRKASLPDSSEAFSLKIPLGSYDHFVSNFENLPPEAKVPPSEYIIKRGDTLGKIARKFELSVEELQATNSLKGHMIHPKQKLLIRGNGISNPIAITSVERQFVDYGEARQRPIKLDEGFQLVELTGSTEDAPLLGVSLSPDIEDNFFVPTIYKVRSGDNLGKISERFQVALKDLQRWNNINGTTIYINQELTIHTEATATAITSTTYKVRSGDNLSAIARRFGVSVANIKRWNGLNNNRIFPGQDLQLN